jgi:hypothetical protein
VDLLPPDPIVQIVRRWTDADGTARVELEIEVDDDVAACLDTLPDPSAWLEDLIRRDLNRTELGRFRYAEKLRSVAAEYGLTVRSYGPDVHGWIAHLPKPPTRLTPKLLKAHRDWLAARGADGHRLPGHDADSRAVPERPLQLEVEGSHPPRPVDGSRG